MPRLIPPAVLMSLTLLTAVPGAAAKEITGMKICGREGCVPLKQTTAQRFHETGALYGASLERDPGPVRHYRLTMLFGDGNGGIAGRVSFAYAPQLRAVLSLDAVPPLPWSRVPKSTAGRLSRLAGGITPLPAKRLASRPATGGVRPPEVWEPWREAAADDGDGLPRPLLAGVPAALVLGLGLVWLRRRSTAV